MELGMPMGCRFFIASRRWRLETFLLPWNVILPTLILGPSFTLKVTATEDGGMGCTCTVMVAKGRPCSASSCCKATLPLVTFVGSYGESTVGPVFSFLYRSSTSLTETEFRPWYSMVRMVGFSLT